MHQSSCIRNRGQNKKLPKNCFLNKRFIFFSHITIACLPHDLYAANAKLGEKNATLLPAQSVYTWPNESLFKHIRK